MDEKFNMTVRFSAEARAATDSFSKAYEVHLQMVKRSLRPIIYNALQQHYLAAEAYAEQNNQPRMLILAFQRGLRHILEWNESEKRRFIQSVGVEQGVSRAMRLPGDILHAINNLLHVLMFTDSEITDLVESGLTHCPGFAIHSVSTVGDVVVQCLQEAAYHFDGSPFLFSRAIKSEMWIENRQKIFNQIDNIIGVVLSEMATNMVGSVCKRLLETRYKQPTVALTLEKGSEDEEAERGDGTTDSGAKKQNDRKTKAAEAAAEMKAASPATTATPKEAKKEPTRYTDTRLLYGHADDQQYLEHAYNRGTYRDTSTPLRVTQGSMSAERVEPRQYSAGTTMAESSSAVTSQPHSKRVDVIAAAATIAQQKEPQPTIVIGPSTTANPSVPTVALPTTAAAAAPKPFYRQIAPPTNMPFQQNQQQQQAQVSRHVAEENDPQTAPSPARSHVAPAVTAAPAPGITLIAQAQVVSGESRPASPFRPISTKPQTTQGGGAFEAERPSDMPQPPPSSAVALAAATAPVTATTKTTPAPPLLQNNNNNNNNVLKSTGAKTMPFKSAPARGVSLVTLDGESPKPLPEDDAASLKNELGKGIVNEGVMSFQLLQDHDAVQSSQ